ncbi:MAG: UDP-N-acetylmuramoyl-L-alanyl-D-glutamate--2,6-diaminopimelate ligase [Sphingobacteriales bacterium]|nr:UDP-N-acetylmuramoyl-L-alanyl-D-glutamate--2,6-diaminopimelate ligase [Sphingobacteriales bacterium]HMS52952.1 UDP-N-acetylmuramoyl-L-alanyl-D-glutamate--2,6-diaminopimelate ligase [Chitinophagales bacterium]MBK6889730.1 UDP-N-acetylmuramoyl-L-alanyl-D-glutamate--2,6-diaminopimelate ligase [Sphingobacteriales bacterium]MBK7527755.1 UDP-N-acetylmuramoyl-L-alanyl-D-glutamate--2,6-diaminopimelate ligase [Sphingobacteriales bacterium]MBK8678741.1 UDP-N-acetylmuramoyl-L-alanyl-D-glutamate--2,6-di
MTITVKHIISWLEKTALVSGNTQINPEIKSLCFDSRKAQPGCLFVALSGTVSDGHNFINIAIKGGAVAVLCEHLPEEDYNENSKLHPDIVYLQTANSAKSLGIIAHNFYGKPSEKLQLVGVTGTNGKTTTATLLHKLFTQLGYTCGLLSTVTNCIGASQLPATHTTPDAISINQILADMVKANCQYCFMEVSSHAVVQNRIAGLHFAGGIFTNISHDHLDYHGSFDAYIKAKQEYFDQLPPTAFALTNIDDRRGQIMVQNTKAKRYTFALKNIANYNARIIENSFSGLLLNLDGIEVHTRLVGEFNAYNLLAIYAAARLLGQPQTQTLVALSNLTTAEGRFDAVYAPSGKITGIVDYAHTPDALANVLKTILATKTGNGQVLTVVGCGGDRDKLKRPQMAKIACEYSNQTIITSDNPRSENPDAIIADMLQGIAPHAAPTVMVNANRREAIRLACRLAQPGDIVLVAGKGHEKYQEINGVKHPFDDKIILKTSFEELNK